MNAHRLTDTKAIFSARVNIKQYPPRQDFSFILLVLSKTEIFCLLSHKSLWF